MKLSHILIIFIICIIIEVFARGVMQGQKELIGFAVLNILLLLFFFLKPLVKRCIRQKYISQHTVYHRAYRRQQFLMQYGATVMTVLLLWQGIQFFLTGSWQWLVLTLVIYFGILRQLRDDLAHHGFRRGKQRMGGMQWGLVGSVLLSISLLGQYWSLGPQKYFRSLFVGLFVYSLVLAFSHYSRGHIRQQVARVLYAGVTLVVGLWVSGVTVMQRYVDHTIEKIVYEEKEKIIYLPAENGELEEKVSEHSVACGVGSCAWSGTCMPLPKYASCALEGEIPWMCDAGYILQDNLCVLSCEAGTCGRQEECVSLPTHAHCTDKNDEPWACDEGYEEQDGTCIRVCASGTCLLGDACVTLPANAFCDEGSSRGWVCDKRYYVVGNECYSRSLLDTSNTTASDPAAGDDTLNILEKYQKKQDTTGLSLSP